MERKDKTQEKDQPDPTQAFGLPSMKMLVKKQNECHQTPGFQKSTEMPQPLQVRLCNVPQVPLSEQISEKIRLQQKKETQK
jgi:hypothetical protein